MPKFNNATTAADADPEWARTPVFQRMKKCLLRVTWQLVLTTPTFRAPIEYFSFRGAAKNTHLTDAQRCTLLEAAEQIKAQFTIQERRMYEAVAGATTQNELPAIVERVLAEDRRV